MTNLRKEQMRVDRGMLATSSGPGLVNLSVCGGKFEDHESIDSAMWAARITGVTQYYMHTAEWKRGVVVTNCPGFW